MKTAFQKILKFLKKLWACASPVLSALWRTVHHVRCKVEYKESNIYIKEELKYDNNSSGVLGFAREEKIESSERD